MEDLVRAWHALVGPHTAAGDVDTTGRALLARWREPHRRYHDIAHLRGILAYIDELADYAEDVDAVRLAAWYHDAVYDGRSDDEERSALRAEADLLDMAVPAAFVAKVVRLIRMTVTHNPAPGDRDGAVLCDADLAALAVSAEEYRRNSAAIRAEYAHVSDDLFRAGRARIVESLLAGQWLFRTPVARERWEQVARANLRTELETLL